MRLNIVLCVVWVKQQIVVFRKRDKNTLVVVLLNLLCINTLEVSPHDIPETLREGFVNEIAKTKTLIIIEIDGLSSTIVSRTLSDRQMTVMVFLLVFLDILL